MDLLFISVTKSWHPMQFPSLQELKFKQKQEREDINLFVYLIPLSICLMNL